MITSLHEAYPRFHIIGDVVIVHEEIALVGNFIMVPTFDAKKVKGQLAEGREKNKFLPSGAPKPQ